MAWACITHTRHVAADAKDVGSVLGHESKQLTIDRYVRAGDWRFDFRGREQLECQRAVSLRERKAKICARALLNTFETTYP